MEIKLMELDPEWVLENFTISQHVRGNGKMTVQTYSLTGGVLMEFLLETLKIDFKVEGEVGDIGDCIFKFRIEDIKSDFPSLYARMIRLNIEILEGKLKSVNELM